VSRESARVRAARRFYEAFDAQDLDGFVSVLHPDVELQTARGIRHGREEARAWATKNPGGGLEQHFVLEELRERGAHVIALYRKQWWWREDSELAHDDEVAALFTFDGDLITRWQPFERRDRAVALFEQLAAR
jgi:hypothetical protein